MISVLNIICLLSAKNAPLCSVCLRLWLRCADPFLGLCVLIVALASGSRIKQFEMVEPAVMPDYIFGANDAA